MKKGEKGWSGSLKAEVSLREFTSVPPQSGTVLGKLLHFHVLLFPLCKVVIIPHMLQSHFYGVNLFRMVFKFLCNGGQAHAPVQLEMLPLQSNLSNTYRQLQANQIDLLHLQI